MNLRCLVGRHSAMQPRIADGRVVYTCGRCLRTVGTKVRIDPEAERRRAERVAEVLASYPEIAWVSVAAVNETLSEVERATEGEEVP